MSVPRRFVPTLVGAASLVAGLGASTATQATNCPPAWSPMQTIRASAGELNVDPQIAVDAAGWAMAAWSEMAPNGTEHILVARRPPGGDWGAPHEVFQSTLHSLFNSEIDLAVGAGGHALLTWRRQDVAHVTRPWVAAFDPDTGWSAAMDLRIPGENWASPASVAVNARGEGVVSWLASSGVYARLFQPLTGWSAIHHGKDWKIDQGRVFETRVAINDAGQAVVAYETLRPRAMRFDPVTGWQAPETLFDHGRTDPARPVEVAIAPSGDAFVAWGDEPRFGAKQAVFVSHFQPGKGWAAAERLSGPNYYAATPDVTTNAQGQALVAWNIVRPQAQARLEAALYRPGNGWGPVIRFTPAANFDQAEAELSDSGLGSVTARQWQDGQPAVFATYSMRTGSDQSRVTLHEGIGPNNDAAGQPNGGLAVSGVAWAGPAEGEAPRSRGTLQARVRERQCNASTSR